MKGGVQNGYEERSACLNIRIGRFGISETQGLGLHRAGHTGINDSTGRFGISESQGQGLDQAGIAWVSRTVSGGSGDVKCLGRDDRVRVGNKPGRQLGRVGFK